MQWKKILPSGGSSDLFMMYYYWKLSQSCIDEIVRDKLTSTKWKKAKIVISADN